jgi:hypothetical protein
MVGKKSTDSMAKNLLKSPVQRGFSAALFTFGVLIAGSLLLPGSAHAASQTWDGGCGIDTSWSCAGNWSENAAPGSGDVVTFNATSIGNSTVDPGFAGTVATVNIGAGYTGTVSLARSLTVSTSFSQTTGTFTAGDQALSTAGFTLSGGHFIASSGTTSIGKAMTITGSPVFSANGGTVDFGGTATAKLSCDNVNFSLVTFTHTAGTKTVSSNCSLPLGDDPNDTGGGSVTLNGSLSGTGTLTTMGLLSLGGTGGISGFSGLVASRLTVNGHYDFGSYTTFTVSGAFVLNSAASFTAPSGTASFGAAFKINSAAAFTANNGTIDFNGTSGTVSCGGKTFNLITLTNVAGTKTINSDCSLPLGDSPTPAMAGSIALNGTLSGTGTLTTGELLTLGSTGSLAGFSGLAARRLTVKGNYDFGSYTTFSVSGAFVLNSAASFTAPSGIASFGAGFTLSLGSTFVANGGVVDFNGSASGTLSCNNASFALVTFTHTGGNKTIGSNCGLPLGKDPTLGSSSAAAVVLSGSLSGAGTLSTQSTFTLNSTASLSGFGGLVADGSLVLKGASIDGSSYKAFAVAGNYTQTGGVVTAPNGANIAEAFTLNNGATFNAPSGTAVFDGRFTINGGATFHADGGTVEFGGQDSRTISCNKTEFHLVTFTHSSGIKTVSSNCSLPLGGNPSAGSGGSIYLSGNLSGSGTLSTGGTLTLAATGSLSGFSGLAADELVVGGAYDFGLYSSFAVDGNFVLGTGAKFVAPAGEAMFSGDFSAEPESTFTANGGTVVLNGTGQAVSGDTTFNNFRKRVSAPDTLMFNAGDTQTIEGTLRLEGKDPGNLLTLASTTPGAPWLIDRQGAAEVAFVSVSDSDNIGSPITPIESVDEGGNSGWIFPGPATELVLAAATTTPTAGATDNLTITAKDAQGNTATSYTGSHNLTFGPVADSPSGAHATVTSSTGTATNFGTATAIGFTEGVATASSGKNGTMTLVKAGSTSLTVTDGSITNGAGLAVTVSPGAATNIAWSNATSTGSLSSLCLFTCTGTGLGNTGNFKANVSITDSSGNKVSALGSGHAVTVTAPSGTITGATLTIASSGPAESATQFAYTPNKAGAVTLTGATSSGTVYTSATASMTR